MPRASRIILIAVITFLAFVHFCAGHIYIQNPSMPSLAPSVFESVPIAWRANPLTFGNTSGLLVLANQTDKFLQRYQELYPGKPKPPIIIADLYPGYRRPYVEDRLVFWARRYQPAAVVFLGEYDEGIYNELGSLDQIILGIDTSEATYPIVQTYWTTWYALKPLLLNGTILNATITDQNPNPWRSLRSSWWFPTWISIGIAWCLGNAIFAGFTLRQYPCARTLSVVVLWIEIASNLMRIPFMMDPFGPWFIPISLVHVFFSMSFPVHLSGAIITLFFWHELVTSTDLEARSGFLTSGKWPAAITVVIMTVVEFTTSAFRAAGYHSLLLNLNSAVYFVVLVALAVLYFYVYALVYRFFKKSPALNRRNAALRKISIRFLFAAITFLVMVMCGALAITRPFGEAVGQSAIHFLIVCILNLGSSFTISAFAFKTEKSKAADSSKTSGTAEESQVQVASSISWKNRNGSSVKSNDVSEGIDDESSDS